MRSSNKIRANPNLSAESAIKIWSEAFYTYFCAALWKWRRFIQSKQRNFSSKGKLHSCFVCQDNKSLPKPGRLL